MRRIIGSGIFIVLMLLVDVYVFQALKSVTQQLAPKYKTILYGAYWGITIIAVAFFLLMPVIPFGSWPRLVRTYLFATIIGLFIGKFIASVFFLADDLRRLLQWGGGKLYYQFITNENFKGVPISRSAFLSWLGFGVGGTVFGSMLLGFANKYRYRTTHLTLAYENLPPAFRGLKLLHISDIHSGSFTDKKAVTRGVDHILAEKADLILFTGDLVNDQADEMKDYQDLFSRLKAPLGVFSTLGNHDYGDYHDWDSPEEKKRNLERLKDIHAEMGWRLLMNEHVSLEKEGQKIALLGIENWSAKGSFPKYGKMDQAHSGSEGYPFKILMSHDPSHWEAQVVPEYGDVDLMLSGHTHGMQFGVEVPGFRWSPVQYVYKQWAGLYEKGRQKLYVNRGFGFIGYPGRVGILPEITVITLA
jgi:predicted MPP superfamily phosphohydrolase